MEPLGDKEAAVKRVEELLRRLRAMPKPPLPVEVHVEVDGPPSYEQERMLERHLEGESVPDECRSCHQQAEVLQSPAARNAPADSFAVLGGNFWMLECRNQACPGLQEVRQHNPWARSFRYMRPGPVRLVL